MLIKMFHNFIHRNLFKFFLLFLLYGLNTLILFKWREINQRSLPKELFKQVYPNYAIYLSSQHKKTKIQFHLFIKEWPYILLNSKYLSFPIRLLIFFVNSSENTFRIFTYFYILAYISIGLLNNPYVCGGLICDDKIIKCLISDIINYN